MLARNEGNLPLKAKADAVASELRSRPRKMRLLDKPAVFGGGSRRQLLRRSAKIGNWNAWVGGDRRHNSLLVGTP